jgi:hypothetical protein
MTVGGVAAALPFRRMPHEAMPDQRTMSVSPPTPVDSLMVSKDGWGNSTTFDPSLAWQPLPMTVPGHHAPELPPMPDSYYDVSFDIQQPQTIRDRFPAAVQVPVSVSRNPRNEPTTGEFAQPDRWIANRQSVPPTFQPLPEKIEVDELITDRFVYTPLAKPQSNKQSQSFGNTIQTPAQSASMTRSNPRAADDPSRPKHFIREPE